MLSAEAFANSFAQEEANFAASRSNSFCSLEEISMTALLESILLVFVFVVFFVFFSSFFSSKKSPSFALVPPPARSLVAAAPLVTAEENAREEDEEEKAKDRRVPAKKEFKRGESCSLVVVPVVVKGENTRIREDILIGKKLAATPLNDFSIVVVAFFSLLTPLLPKKREERSAEDTKNRREAREERIFLMIYV
tara:strand:- start:8999 stop:9580 length:582 start_codon:yes stop_codon:yes gene_type:complete